MYLRPAVTLHGLAAGVTATFVTALVSMDCMNAFHHVVVQLRLPYSARPQLGTESRFRCRRAPTVRTGGVRDEISRFSYPRDFSNSDLITVNMWVVTSFVIEVFPSIVSDLCTDGGLALVGKLSYRDHVRTAAIAVGPNRKPPSPIKYDGLTCTFLETNF